MITQFMFYDNTLCSTDYSLKELILLVVAPLVMRRIDGIFDQAEI